LEGLCKDLRSFLVWWSVTCFVPRTHVTSLLKGLKNHVEVPYNITLNLPSDYRALLKTPRNVSKYITKLAGGAFANLGLKPGLERIVKQGADFSDIQELRLTTFLDGFSPHRKRGKKFWAVLHQVEIPSGGYSPVFMSGIYAGPENPANFDHLLRNFVEDFNSLRNEPFFLDGLEQPFKIIFRCAVCDMPSKGDAKGS
jgi:hypothetical protein